MLLLDITQISRQPFLTGIQRIVREFWANNDEDVRLIRFDTENQVYRFQESIPRLVRRHHSPLRLLLLKILLFVSLPIRHQNNSTALAPRWIIKLGQALLRDLNEFELVEDPEWRSAPIYFPRTGDNVLLLDIPQDSRHLRELHQLATNPNVSLIVYLHDLIPLRQSHLYDDRPWSIRVGSFADYFDLVSQCDVIFTNSRWTANEFQNELSAVGRTFEGKLEVLYPPLKCFGGAVRGKVSSKSEVSEKLRVLAIGALDRRKNFIFLVDLLVDLLVDFRQIELTIVAGSGKLKDPDLSRVVRAAKKKNGLNMRILKAVDDEELSRLYGQADVLLVTSLVEGFGLPVVEALCRGTRVLVPDHSGIGEIAGLLGVPKVGGWDKREWRTKLLETVAAPTPRLDIPPPFPGDWGEFLRRIEDR